jgi:hypothetical protein
MGLVAKPTIAVGCGGSRSLLEGDLAQSRPNSQLNAEQTLTYVGQQKKTEACGCCQCVSSSPQPNNSPR